MTATRPYHSPARQVRRERTRQAIVDAFIAQLGDAGRIALSPAAAARAAGVSIRTVHHYFPDAEAQLAAVAAEVETRLFPQPACAAADTGRTARPGHRGLPGGSEGQLPLLRALVASSVGTSAPTPPRRRLQAIQDVLASIGAGHGETRRASPSCPCSPAPTPGLSSPTSTGSPWTEAGAACAEATRAIISHLTTQATPGTTPAPSEPHHH